MRLCGMVMSGLGMLLPFGVIAFLVMLCGGLMGLRSILVMLGSFLV